MHNNLPHPKHSSNRPILSIELQDIEVWQDLDMPYQEVDFITDRGSVNTRYYSATDKDAKVGIICIGGAGGGWDTPSRGLYPRLCQEFNRDGKHALRVRYRYPADLGESIIDVMIGVHFLASRGVEQIGIVGHSFGGAVAIQVAASENRIRSVVALAPQTFGSDVVAYLSDRCPLMVVHGTDDEILPSAVPFGIYSEATSPKSLVIVEGGKHNLDEHASVIKETVTEWLKTNLVLPTVH